MDVPSNSTAREFLAKNRRVYRSSKRPVQNEQVSLVGLSLTPFSKENAPVVPPHRSVFLLRFG